MTSFRDIQTSKHALSAPSLEELVQVLAPALEANYSHSSVEVIPCPDLREAPFHLAAPGLSGDERIAEIGGQSNLVPQPRLDAKYSLIDLAQRMELSPSGGALLGAGAGPFHDLGQNAELAANLSWTNSFDDTLNKTYYTKVSKSDGKTPSCHLSPSHDCALMMNLFASAGKPGPVLRITAKGRRRNGAQEKSFPQCLRKALHTHYSSSGGNGVSRIVSMGGVFALKRGKGFFHVMPDFPPEEELPWKSREEVERWLTYHDFGPRMTCLSVLHSADPREELGLRLEHTHCFSVVGEDGRGGEGGGHYHYDLLPEDRDGEAIDEVEYEGYFNVARWIYRIDRPKEERDGS